MKHNKVYVRIAEDDDFGTASIEPRPFAEAYIRKDTLLGWAKEQATEYKGTANIRRSFEMMIRKIESL